MSSSTDHPRPDHVAALTGNLPLPLPAIEDIHMQVIVDWIARAWSHLVSDHAGHLRYDDEEGITVLLETQLLNLLDDDQPWSQLIERVDRAKCINHDGRRLEKGPDMSIHLTTRRRQFPLHVECMIIDRGKGVSLYCKDGVSRFVRGDYAWAAQEAMMIAYVRNASTIDPGLQTSPRNGSCDRTAMDA